MKKRSKKEKNEEESVRERVRQKKRKKKIFSGFLAFLVFLAIFGLSYMFAQNLISRISFKDEGGEEIRVDVQVKTEVINENKNKTIPQKTMEYISLLESDLEDLGLSLIRVIIPKGMMRELDVDIEGVKPYFKVSLDRGSAVSAEDISRMIKYLRENNLAEGVGYVDVRVEGKAFYK